MKNLLRAWRYFVPDRARIFLVGMLLLASTALNLLKPWPLAIIVDCVLGQKPLPAWLSNWVGPLPTARMLLLLTGVTLFLHLGQGILQSAQNFLSIQVGLRGLQRVRNELFARLLRLSMTYCQGARMGDLIYRASWDTFAFQTLFQQGLVTSATAVLSLGMMVVVMWKLDVGLTFAALATVPFVLAAIQYFGRRMRDKGVSAQQADSQITAMIQQTLSALPLIQSYTRETIGAKVFAGHSVQARDRRMAQHGWELLYWLAVSAAFSVGTAVVVWLGSREVQSGSLSVGGLLIFLAYLAQLYEPLNWLSHAGATISTASGGIQRVYEVLDAKDSITELPTAQRVVGVGDGGVEKNIVVARGNLEFQQVSFAYQPGQLVLAGVNLSIRAGEVVAIIGASGVGKTTLLNLLPRFFDPASGRILLEGADLRELRLEDLRRQIGLVTQEGVLLAGTMAENIAFGQPEATLDRIQAAARAAQADEFIRKLPEGYQTLMGDGAASLSVGEKQRISLARAFLKNAPILLLDEPTSALDVASEAQVMASLEKLMRGRTTLMVTHRQATLRHANRFLLLKNGQVSELSREQAMDYGAIQS